MNSGASVIAPRGNGRARVTAAGLGALTFLGLASPANAAPDAAAACQALTGQQITASRISLPTGGATVTSAVMTKGAGAEAGPEFCKAVVLIKPVDRSAPDIHVQVNLPTDWNGKALQFGGGGYNGRIPDSTGWPSHGLTSGPTPLARGYFTLSDDSGHQAPNANDGSFAVNDEALANFGYMHIRKALDVATVIAQRRYGKGPRRTYFAGGSTGGREGLTAALRWPEVYDGVISNYPTANFLGLRLENAALTRAIYADDSAGWIEPALVERIARESLAECDGLDGVADGIVSDMAACRAGAEARLQKWKCPQASAPCLTQAQVDRTIRIYHEGFTDRWQEPGSLNGYTGYNVLEGVPMALGSQREFSRPLAEGPSAHAALRADEFLANFVARDPKFDVLRFDVKNPGPLTQRLKLISRQIGATSPDFRPFAQRGGKILLLQGADDALVSPYENIRRYEAIVARMGRPAVGRFLRFYLVPGQGHGVGRFKVAWDNLDILDAWVDRGVAPPVTPIGFDSNRATAGRSRPICEYPKWPKYNGAGDPNLAASFTCVE